MTDRLFAQMMPPPPLEAGELPLHGSAVAYRLGRRHGAALLLGAPGSGKSTLALRAMRQTDARLVGDDQLRLQRRGGRVVLRSAPSLAGFLHVAGVGIVRRPHLSAAPLVLAVEMSRGALPLLPPRRSMQFLGCAFPVLTLDPFEAAAPERLEAAVRHLADAPAPCAAIQKAAS